MRAKPKSAYVIRSLESTPELARWSVIKMNTDMELLDTYYISEGKSHTNQILCSCYAGSQFKPCRHKLMLELFTKEGAIDSGRLHVYDGRPRPYWIEPIDWYTPSSEEEESNAA